MPKDTSRVCRRCSGLGYVLTWPRIAPLSSGSFYPITGICPECEGRGYNLSGPSVRCGNCGGKGKIQIERTLFYFLHFRKEIECSECLGTGFVRRDADGRQPQR